MNCRDKVYQYYHTLSHLQIRQVAYRLWYALRARVLPTKRKPGVDCQIVSKSDIVAPFPKRLGLYTGTRRFSFLNFENEFKNPVGWDYQEYGKLWTYNLNYFDYLLDENMSLSEGLALMDAFMDSVVNLKNANEPYPISLRILNWVKFLQQYEIEDLKYIRFIVSDLDLLSRMPEYHLMGNHLLENGFALYFGGTVTGLYNYSSLGKGILLAELDEQILADGGHFERSPMYHLILLERLLDCVNVAIPNEKDESFLEFLKLKAQKMVHWINSFSFVDKTYGMVNDAAYDIAKPIPVVLDYAAKLGFDITNSTQLNESGYRKLIDDNFEMVIDVGDIGPDYIPGHAHSDTLSFVLNYEGNPIIVDTGTSTYEANDRRQLERSTRSHNTVMLNGIEQTEIWGAFRVARRAKASILIDKSSHVVATHDGYKRLGLQHTRSIQLKNCVIEITDKLNNATFAEAWLHFHPSVELKEFENGRFQANGVFIEISDFDSIKVESYQFATGFNLLTEAQRLHITFRKSLLTKIYANPIS